ncbi:MAG: hypothetical protein K0U45_01000 [Alphaproteobacteria bacterium]|nr:hypothetical protein [Alphaproteobacteria bacterium]
MVSVSVEKNVVEILQAFLDDKMDNPLSLLEKFGDDDFYFQIKFDKYEQSINAPVAQVIIDFQFAIYRIAALCMCGHADIRKLSAANKSKLEIPFKISNGSTITETKDLAKVFKGLLKMIPEKDRKHTLIVVLAMVFSFWGFSNYSQNRFELERERLKLESEVEMEMLELEKEKLRIKEKENIYRDALSKIKSENQPLSEIYENHNEEQLSNFINIDEKIEINGDSFSKAELKEIKKEVSKRSKTSESTDTESYFVEGDYYIIHVNIKESMLTIENIKDGTLVIASYGKNNVFTDIQEQNKNIHSAFDNKAKIFKIKFNVTENGKTVNREIIDITDTSNANTS